MPISSQHLYLCYQAYRGRLRCLRFSAALGQLTQTLDVVVEVPRKRLTGPVHLSNWIYIILDELVTIELLMDQTVLDEIESSSTLGVTIDSVEVVVVAW